MQRKMQKKDYEVVFATADLGERFAGYRGGRDPEREAEEYVLWLLDRGWEPPELGESDCA